MKDTDGEIFLHYSEDIGLKTNKGGINQCKIQAKHVDLYATDDPDYCPLCFYTEVSQPFTKGQDMPQSFYLQPRKKYFEKLWYLNCPTGVNKL